MESKGQENVQYGEGVLNRAHLNDELAAIPEAAMLPIDMTDIKNSEAIQAIIVGGDIVATTSRHYKLVQHKEAFAPVVDGLNKLGINYDYRLQVGRTRALLNLFVDEARENGGMIKLGFSVKNGIDGANAITYSACMSQHTKKTVIELVGYRLVCKNGMKIRIPLEELQADDELRLEKHIEEHVKELLKTSAYIVHIGDVEKKLMAVEAMVEAVGLFRRPIELMITRAKKTKLGQAQAKALIGFYMGKRLTQAVEDQFKLEDASLWGLYNAMTYVASHGVSQRSENGLIDRAADLLEGELFHPEVSEAAIAASV